MQKIEKNEVNLRKCVCENCPSFNECAEGRQEKLFCAEESGKSECKFSMNVCICGSCPVHKEHHLKSGYYCINGFAETADDK